MNHPPHWAYFASLEDDLVDLGKYVEICESNYSTFSIQLTRLLLAAGSEVDVVAKTVCQQIDPNGKFSGIEDYRKTIPVKYPAICTVKIGIQWNPLRVSPWSSWADPKPKNPDWWTAYNNVKHKRHMHFTEGNLKHVVEAIAGLYCLILHLDENKGHPKPCRFLRVESSS